MGLVEKAIPSLRLLLPKGARVVVAASGGPDSQALLDVIATHASDLQLGRVFAAGVNHGLRVDADQELNLAASLAASLGVPFSRLNVQVATCGNLLANAREARYRCLFEHMNEISASHLAVAHTANDQAETVLFRLARGSGIKGAAGMRERRGCLVRPLLWVTRAEIMDYLQERGVVYASDPSNVDLRRMRAQLRAHVMPALTTINSGAIANLCRFAKRMQRTEALLTRLARARVAHYLGPYASLAHGAVQGGLGEHTLRAWLRHHGIKRATQQDVARVLALRSEGACASIGSRQVVVSRGAFWLGDGPMQPCTMDIPGRTAVPQLPIVLDARVFENTDRNWATWCSSSRVAFDADKLHLPLSVRGMGLGDRLPLFGSGGTTKVGDLFTNLKVPAPLRASWPLLTSGNNIAWVVGLKRSAVAPVTEDTRRVLVIEIDGVLPWSPEPRPC